MGESWKYLINNSNDNHPTSVISSFTHNSNWKPWRDLWHFLLSSYNFSSESSLLNVPLALTAFALAQCIFFHWTVAVAFQLSARLSPFQVSLCCLSGHFNTPPHLRPFRSFLSWHDQLQSFNRNTLHSLTPFPLLLPVPCVLAMFSYLLLSFCVFFPLLYLESSLFLNVGNCFPINAWLKSRKSLVIF